MHVRPVRVRTRLSMRACLRACTGAGRVASKLLLKRSSSSETSPAKLSGSSEMRLCDSSASLRFTLSQNGTNASRSVSFKFLAARPPVRCNTVRHVAAQSAQRGAQQIFARGDGNTGAVKRALKRNAIPTYHHAHSACVQSHKRAKTRRYGPDARNFTVGCTSTCRNEHENIGSKPSHASEQV
jgi:hypothetical protein